jgi:phage protein D
VTVPQVAWTLQIAFAPAPPPVVDAVIGIEVDASIDQASAFRIRLGLPQTLTGDWGILQLDPFRPLVPVTIRVAVGVVPEAVINGYVTEQHITYSDTPGGTALEVSGLDATVLMNMQERVVPWPSMPDSAVAAAIFGQYGVVPKVQPTGPVLVEPEGTQIQRGTDIRFLRRLARRHGFECFVQPEPLTGVDTGHFEPRSLVGVPGAVLLVNEEELTNVSGFSVQYDMVAPTGAVAANLDVPTKSPQLGIAPVSTQVPLGAEPVLTRILPPPNVRPVETGLVRSSDLQAAAQSVADRSSWAVVASGTTGSEVGLLRPGTIVNIAGAGRVYSGSYYVTRVHHRIGPDGYTQRFEAERNAVTMTGTELFVPL